MQIICSNRKRKQQSTACLAFERTNSSSTGASFPGKSHLLKTACKLFLMLNYVLWLLKYGDLSQWNGYSTLMKVAILLHPSKTLNYSPFLVNRVLLEALQSRGMRQSQSCEKCLPSSLKPKSCTMIVPPC